MTIPPSRAVAIFSDDDAERLDAMLDRFLDQGGLPLEGVDGLLSAIVVATDVIPPSEYVPYILGAHEPGWESAERAQEFFALLMRLNNHIAQRVSNHTDEISLPFLMMPVDIDNLDDAALASTDLPLAANWATGFMIGVGMRGDDWDERSADTAGFAETLHMIALLLPDPTAANGKADGLGGSAKYAPMTLGERMRIVGLLPDILRRMYLDRLERTLSRVPVRRDPKVGRNDPCQCGSGEKYKKCHGEGAH